jgi:hypothetical protein
VLNLEGYGARSEKRYALLVEGSDDHRSSGFGYLHAAWRVLLNIATQGFTDRSKTYVVVYDTATNEPIARWDWGEDHDAAVRAVPALQEELNDLGVVRFCQKYHLH